MNIRKVELNDGGLKGATVHYFEEVEKNERKAMELTKKYPKNPVHLGLEKLFKDLRIHLLEVCGLVNDSMDKNVKDMIINQTFVDWIEFDGECIVIHGDKEVFEDKYITLKTPKLQIDDGYEHYESVVAITERIAEETKEYLAGTKVVSDEEVIVRYAQMKHKEDEFSIDKIKGLTPEQLRDMATKIIEKGLGGIVTLPDENIDPAFMEEAVEEIRTEFAIDSDATIIPIDVPEKVTRAKKQKKQEKVLVATPAGMSVQNNTEEEF